MDRSGNRLLASQSYLYLCRLVNVHDSLPNAPAYRPIVLVLQPRYQRLPRSSISCVRYWCSVASLATGSKCNRLTSLCELASKKLASIGHRLLETPSESMAGTGCYSYSIESRSTVVRLGHWVGYGTD